MGFLSILFVFLHVGDTVKREIDQKLGKRAARAARAGRARWSPRGLVDRRKMHRPRGLVADVCASVGHPIVDFLRRFWRNRLVYSCATAASLTLALRWWRPWPLSRFGVARFRVSGIPVTAEV